MISLSWSAVLPVKLATIILYLMMVLLQAAVLANTLEGMVQRRVSPKQAAPQQLAPVTATHSNKRKTPAGMFTCLAECICFALLCATFLCHNPSLAHNPYTTTPMPQPLCHTPSATTPLPQPLCHDPYATTPAPQPLSCTQPLCQHPLLAACWQAHPSFLCVVEHWYYICL